MLGKKKSVHQLLNGFEEDHDDGDVVGGAVVFGQSHELLTHQIKIVCKK